MTATEDRLRRIFAEAEAKDVQQIAPRDEPRLLPISRVVRTIATAGFIGALACVAIAVLGLFGVIGP